MAGNPRKAKSAGSFRESMAKNYRYFIVGGLFLILVIVLVIFLATRGTDVVKEGEQNSAIEDIASSVEVPKDKYEQDAYPNVNTICTSYMNAMSIGDSDTMASLSNALSDERRAFFEAQAQYISQYADYHFYTKAGPEENSYLVLVTYTLQIVSDANKLPALCSLYVCTDESGTLYINNSDLSENDEAYILALASQDDFKQLQDDVQLAYNDMLENPDLSARVTELRGQINSDVQAKLEAKKQAETEAAAAQAAEEAAALAAANAKTVRATDVVNIRSSSSTDSEVLGKTSQGQEFTRYEVLENGWSKIDYNGQEAYIKTEYLEEVNQEAGAESSEVAANVREPGSTITVKENANIRSQPNTDSDSLGKASSGDTFTLVEEKDGWCKFTYDGKDAYIRSDLIQ